MKQSGARASAYGSQSTPPASDDPSRRPKPRSRFDMPYPPGSKWDAQEYPSSKGSILEDYMLEDEEKSKPKPSQPESRWRTLPVARDDPPVPAPEPPTIPQSAWQAGTEVQQQNFAGYGQPAPPPAPTYSQTSYYQGYDYSQQYAGYSNYYQGYSDYGQGWGAPAAQQPPPPGLILPDMSQPPPVQPPVAVATTAAAPPAVPPPAPVPTPTPVPVPSVVASTKLSKKSASSSESPSPERERKKKKKKEKSKDKDKERSRERSKEKDRDKERSKEKDKEKKKEISSSPAKNIKTVVDELKHQREDYMRKKALLTRELEQLVAQQRELMAESPVDGRILRENAKLQDEIKGKLQAFDNVLGIIAQRLDEIDPGQQASEKRDKRKRSKSRSKERSSSSMGINERKKSSPSSGSTSSGVEEQKEPKEEEEQANYSFFDPEEHWCRVCNKFPATAKEYLNHLHSEEHKDNLQKKKLTDLPWHANNKEKERPHIPGAPIRRLPIKGLQFFIATTGWYCKMCHSWIGDLHCASLHLKSKLHMDNYEMFTQHDPGWEERWSEERQKAFQRSEEEQGRMQELQRVRKQIEEMEAPVRPNEPWHQPQVIESLKITVANDEMVREEEDPSQSIRVQMRKQAIVEKSLPPMGPALPPTGPQPVAKKQKWEAVTASPVQSNGTTFPRGQWVVKQTAVAAGTGNTVENEKEVSKGGKDRPKNKTDSEEPYRRDRKRDRRYDRSRSRDRSRSYSRGRYRSRSRDRDRDRSRDYDRSRSRDRDRDRRSRRRRSSSPRRGRSYSRSRSPEDKGRKLDPPRTQWVAPPSSPPPYLNRKTEEKDKWDKPKKKPQPPPAAALPKSKLPFIGRMPLLKRIAKKKQGDEPEKVEATSTVNISNENKPPEDMDIDSGASDSEQNAAGQVTPTAEDSMGLVSEVPPTEAAVPVHTQTEGLKNAAGIPLPQDFQDALSILFPEPNAMGMHAPDGLAVDAAAPQIKKQCGISEEELLMLGIDPEDMVAQQF